MRRSQRGPYRLQRPLRHRPLTAAYCWTVLVSPRHAHTAVVPASTAAVGRTCPDTCVHPHLDFNIDLNCNSKLFFFNLLTSFLCCCELKQTSGCLSDIFMSCPQPTARTSWTLFSPHRRPTAWPPLCPPTTRPREARQRPRCLWWQEE